DAGTILQVCTSEDASGNSRADPECVLRNIEHALDASDAVRINRRAVLANFSFAKMAMVEDLRRNGDALARNPVIAALAGHGESRRRMAESVIDLAPSTLDDRLAVDDYLVLDADSTQHRAIVLV